LYSSESEREGSIVYSNAKVVLTDKIKNNRKRKTTNLFILPPYTYFLTLKFAPGPAIIHNIAEFISKD
jgi:hypothetical protein